MFTVSRPRPSPDVARAIWLWGARIVFALWAVTALVLLAAGELSAIGQAKLAGLFGLLLAGWTAAWLYTCRRPVPAVR
jgi:hypothetical protein